MGSPLFPGGKISYPVQSAIVATWSAGLGNLPFWLCQGAGSSAGKFLRLFYLETRP